MTQGFEAWGRFVHRFRYAVIAVALIVVALSGLYGLDLSKKLSQEGWFDDTSESVKGSKIADATFGRETDADVIALYSAPDGVSIDDPVIRERARARFDSLLADHGDVVLKVDSYWDSRYTTRFGNGQYAFASIGLRSQGSQTLLDYRTIKDDLDIAGLNLQLAGLQPVVDALNDGMQRDIHRAELIALPVVAVLLYFVFGGVVAALLPVLIGGMTIVASQGLMRLETYFVDVNAFATAVVTLVSLGLAIDYGLFIVTRFREELASGHSTEDAVALAVSTAGRTVVFSGSVIAVCIGALLIYPHGVLKSMPYGAIVSVVIAAFLSISVLPALLSILGRNIDWLEWKRFSRTQTPDEIDRGFWSRLAVWAMRRPKLVVVPIVLVLLALIVPFTGMRFAGLSERYLAPDDPARVAQQQFDELFPQFRTERIRLVVVGASNEELSDIAYQANGITGMTGPFEQAAPATDGVNLLRAGLVDKNDAGRVVRELRAMDVPSGVTVYVAGIPALEYDSIQGLIKRLPVLGILLVVASIVLMYMAFGSVVLAVKAIIVSALSLGATLGMLTWIFVDGHGSSLLGFTPGPIMFAVLVVIVAVIFGLSTDYEVFLMSRMVEARRSGASTPEAIRFGIARTGGVITAAASILIVVTAAFALSDLVLMKCLAVGMIAALVLDASLIRMLLVPAVMKLLGDRCWWKPSWLPTLRG